MYVSSAVQRLPKAAVSRAGKCVANLAHPDIVAVPAVPDAPPVADAGGPDSVWISTGAPTDDEIAVLIYVLATIGRNGAAIGPNGPVDNWGDTHSLRNRGTDSFVPYAFPHLSRLRD